MEVAKTTIFENKHEEDDDDVMLPGYRFYPTDEELVGFYLRRKVENKPLAIELIKQIDIYKYDPWDLPKVGMGDKEWYFFCKRGRKYRNSARPNRVTGSGFWKATGIDKPIYSIAHSHDHCIGLKKSLVYYRGCAGKGTKTDWMMHEFRLPPTGNDHNSNHHMNAKNIDQEAEVWTLCRIFKRIPTYKKYTPHLKDTKIINKNDPSIDSSSKTCSLESDNREQYVSFGDSSSINLSERRNMLNQLVDERNQHVFMGQMNMSSYWDQPPLMTSSFWSPNENGDDFFRDGNWDELRLVVELAN